jgi:uncharacterized membrane protein YgaE (UPF0421/DUF939 family)
MISVMMMSLILQLLSVSLHHSSVQSHSSFYHRHLICVIGPIIGIVIVLGNGNHLIIMVVCGSILLFIRAIINHIVAPSIIVIAMKFGTCS